ncbi:hypothetical protein [Nonomuraea sp. NPDC049141]|uniref:hypothetical protein n=1 Tax=Nonomuraea sp. NPDC049141 TaxID=3155500 RepID=UPI0033F6E273
MNLRRKLSYLFGALTSIVLAAFALGDQASAMIAAEGPRPEEPDAPAADEKAA